MNRGHARMNMSTVMPEEISNTPARINRTSRRRAARAPA
jgi:hypothetical protein